jgi:Fe-Mn family superoxide dismutase
METHHCKHHRAYVDNLNKSLELNGLQTTDILEVQRLIGKGVGGDLMRNNGGGHYNHALFWKWMAPVSTRGQQPSPALLQKIVDQWGSLDEMRKEFNEAATKRFGSGWAWLGVKPDGSLAISSSPNQGKFYLSLASVIVAYSMNRNISAM